MTKTEARNIGIAIEAPKQSCADVKCPFHGNLSTRGRQFMGTVTSTKTRKTAIVEFERLHFLKKYERYEKRRTKLKAHNPECINAKDGDIVIAEVDGGWTMKYFKKKGNLIYLKPANKNYSPIYPQYDLKVAAIVKGVIRKY